MINLEQELIKGNRKILLDKELLVLKEFENLEKSGLDQSVLERVGIDISERGTKIKHKLKHLGSFDRERVFHKDQIKEVCFKFRLKFLGSALYKGHVDPNLALKLNTFELAHKIKCFSEIHKEPWKGTFVKGNTFIMAPQESFELQERPKDPLFFYQIDKHHFYLIHKWGNDLSNWRRLKGLFTPRVCLGLVVLMIPLILGFLKVPFGIIAVPTGISLMVVICLMMESYTFDKFDPFSNYK